MVRDMKKEDAFLFDECFVLMGFVLSLRGYEILGFLAGCIAIAYGFLCMHANVLKGEWGKIVSVSFVQLVLLQISHLNEAFPSLYFLTATSLIVSYTWDHAGYKAVRYGMKWMNGAGLVFMLATILWPYRIYTFFETFLIVAFIFLPSDLLYLKRQYLYYSKRKHGQKKAAVVQ